MLQFITNASNLGVIKSRPTTMNLHGFCCLDILKEVFVAEEIDSGAAVYGQLGLWYICSCQTASTHSIHIRNNLFTLQFNHGIYIFNVLSNPREWSCIIRTEKRCLLFLHDCVFVVVRPAGKRVYSWT